MTAEDRLQIAVTQLLDYMQHSLKFIWFHVANEGGIKLPIQVCRKRKAMGVKAGVPDIILIKPGGQVIQIELKTAKGQLNSNQRAWRNRSRELEIPYYICRSIDEVKAIVEKECQDKGIK